MLKIRHSVLYCLLITSNYLIFGPQYSIVYSCGPRQITWSGLHFCVLVFCRPTESGMGIINSALTECGARATRVKKL